MADLNGEIREIRETLAGIRSDIKCLPDMRKDINALGKHYAALAEKMEHPCGDHTEVVERIAQLEAVRNGEQSAGGRGRNIVQLWFMGIAMTISVAAFLYAVLK